MTRFKKSSNSINDSVLSLWGSGRVGVQYFLLFTFFVVAADLSSNTSFDSYLRKLSESPTVATTAPTTDESVEKPVKDVVPTSTDNSAMSLWWMSNLRDTPLRMTEATNSTTTRQFVFPPETKRVWVDVGVHRQTDFMRHLERDDSLFVLGFEPSTNWKPCEHKHCAVFWAAATPDYDVVNLNIQSADGLCNSLLKPNTDTSARIFKGCVTQETDEETGKPKTVQVPGIPLHALVERIPQDIQIEYVKIDAQGFDLEVAKGALKARDRIQVMVLEAMDVKREDQLLYYGQPMAHQVQAFLEEHGWILVRKVVNRRGAGGEVNMFFASDQQYIDTATNLIDHAINLGK